MCVSLKEWRDDRLTWEAEEFDNLTQFVVDSPLIWTPELALINAYESLTFLYIYIYSNLIRVHYSLYKHIILCAHI